MAHVRLGLCSLLIVLVACSGTGEDELNPLVRSGNARGAGGEDVGGAVVGDGAPGAGSGSAGGSGTGSGSGTTRPPAASGFPGAFDEGVTYATAQYVSPTGSDSSGTGTRAAPYASLRRALQARTPGAEIVLLAGRYSAPGHIGSPQGTAAAPIKIRGEGTVVIDGSGGGVGLAMSDPRYVVIENMTIENAPIHGMNIDDGGSYSTPGDNVVLRRVTFRNIGSGGNNDCLKMSGVDHFYVTESDFSNCRVGEAIDMVGCHDGVITGNQFHDTPGTGVQAKGGSRDVLIHGNVFRNVAIHAINMGGSTGDPHVRPANAPFEGERIVAMSNVIEGSRQASIAFLGCGSCLAANNTIVNPSMWIVRILQGSRDTSIVRSRDGHFINNVVYYRQGSLRTILNVGGNTDPGTFAFGNNLYFATDGAAFGGTHSGTGVPAETGSVLQQDPRFVDVAAGDYHLASTSPARAQGRPLPFGTLFDFAAQLPNTPSDLGAHDAP